MDSSTTKETAQRYICHRCLWCLHSPRFPPSRSPQATFVRIHGPSPHQDLLEQHLLESMDYLYIPRDSPHQDLLKQHLLESMDHLHTKYPDIGFAIMET